MNNNMKLTKKERYLDDCIKEYPDIIYHLNKDDKTLISLFNKLYSELSDEEVNHYIDILIDKIKAKENILDKVFKRIEKYQGAKFFILIKQKLLVELEAQNLLTNKLKKYF